MNVTFYIPNLRSAAFTAGNGFTADANYPLLNLFNGIPEIPAKSTATTTAQRIVMDQGAAKTFDSVILLNHNFTTTDGLRIRCASNSGISADVETVLATATPQADGDLVLDDILPFTKRYIAVEWMGSAPLPEVPRLGGLYVCERYTFPKPWEWEGTNAFYTDYGHTSESYTLSGIRRASQQFGGWALLVHNYRVFENADRDMLQVIFNAVRGPLIPFMLKDETGALYYAHFVNKNLRWTPRGYNMNDLAEPLMLRTVRASYGVSSGLDNTEEVITYT